MKSKSASITFSIIEEQLGIKNQLEAFNNPEVSEAKSTVTSMLRYRKLRHASKNIFNLSVMPCLKQ